MADAWLRTTLPRGTCATCGAGVALRKGGLVREHRSRPGSETEAHGWRTCPGSGQYAIETRPVDMIAQGIENSWLGDGDDV